MDEDGDWVMIRRPTEKDSWEPSLFQTEPSDPLKVRFNGPAKHWTDAVPIGNGRLGATVWGGVQLETLNLNEDTLWTGNPGNYTNPEAPKALTEVRKLVDNGQYAEATTKAVKLSGTFSEVDIFCVLRLSFVEHRQIRRLGWTLAATRGSHVVASIGCLIRFHYILFLKRFRI